MHFMKLLIAGSRSITEFDLAPHIPSDTTTIISGGAKGIDTLAEDYVDKNGLEKVIVRPEYTKYGRAAPIKRNYQMVDMCDSVLVIWDCVSKGTESTIRYAEKNNKKIYKIIFKKQQLHKY